VSLMDSCDFRLYVACRMCIAGPRTGRLHALCSCEPRPGYDGFRNTIAEYGVTDGIHA
jgi:hypothetical protein